jgi:glycosyltransferase involved in cell wall biosynthesis
MKILYIIASLDKRMGGTTVSILNYYNAIKKEADIKIATTFTNSESAYIDDCLLNDKNILFFPVSIGYWRFSYQLYNYIKKNINNFDIVHVHGLWVFPTYYGARCANRSDIPCIVSPHGMVQNFAISQKRIKKFFYWTLFERHVFNMAKLIHCITLGEEASVKTLSSTKAFVLPNGVFINKYKERKHHQPDSLLFVGRLHPIKGIENLIKSIGLIDHVNLIIAGKGTKEYEVYLQRLVCDLGLNNRINFVGFVEKNIIHQLYDQSTALIVSSYTEVLSLVAIEALADSMPVIITKQCDFEDIQKYNAGVIIKNNLPFNIADGIKVLLSMDHELLTRNAHKLALNKFDINKLGASLLSVYKDNLS